MKDVFFAQIHGRGREGKRRRSIILSSSPMAATDEAIGKRPQSVSQVYPLALPKGVRNECELCGKLATLQCSRCRVTYYCCQDHMDLDWMGVHEKTCALLQDVRTPPPLVGSEETRTLWKEARESKQRLIIDVATAASAAFLAEEEHELALPSALQCLRFSIEVYGQGNNALVLPYFLMAEAHLGMGRFRQSEENLSLANWIILKNTEHNPEACRPLKSQLHRNYGKLYAAEGRSEESLKHFAHHVYFASLMHGPESIEAAEGYYHMSSVFFTQASFENSRALMAKVASILYKRHFQRGSDPHTVIQACQDHLDRIVRMPAEVFEFMAGLFYQCAGLLREAQEHFEASNSTFHKIGGPGALFALDAMLQAKKRIARGTAARLTNSPPPVSSP